MNFLLIVIAYLIGALPFSLMVARAKGVDLRSVGSGNPGATNVGRALGVKYGVFVLLLDTLKGYLPVLLLPRLAAGGDVAWNLDVLRPGRYEVTLMYSVPAADSGATIQVELGGQRRQAILEHAHDPQPPSPEALNRQLVRTSGPVWVSTWAPVTFDPVDLPEGPAKLVIRASKIPGAQAFELKEAHLRRLD